MKAQRLLAFPLVLVSLSISAQPAAIPKGASPLDPKLQAGQAVYEQHCAACHGVKGDGSGPASVWLFPRPRNFSAGLFKIKSTPGTALPTDEDLLSTVTRGMPGSSMPSFTYLTEGERRSAVEYVKYLTAYTDASGKRINRFEEGRKSNELAAPISVPPEPPVTVQSLADGARLFSKLNCVMCHGETGAGDGPNASSLKDTQGLYLPPRDFNTGAFRGGHTGRDLFTRIAIGLAGTPMVAFDNKVMTDRERWSLVHFIQSFRRKDVEINDLLAPTDGLVHVPRVRGKLPVDPADPSWEGMDPTRITLNPLWPEKDTHLRGGGAGGSRWQAPGAALHLEGPGARRRAGSGSGLSGRGRVAVLDEREYAFPGDGRRQQPRQHLAMESRLAAGGRRPPAGHGRAYPSMHVDTYFRTSYRTAADAGNEVAIPHRSPVEDANARGFGTLKSQPASGQNVSGKGIWRDGSWSVIFLRDLKSKEADDVKLAVGKPVPVAFAVWDGQNRDRNGRKVVSNWHKLILEP